MKNVRFLVAGAVVMLFLISSFIMVNPETINAAEKQSEKCLIISLNGTISRDNPAKMDQSVSITPQYLQVSKGDCVVWVNWIRGPEISTSFKDGKSCSVKTTAPVGYRLTPDTGCYLTDYLGEGETSSLRFMETGDYKYEVFIKGGTAPLASGTITVK